MSHLNKYQAVVGTLPRKYEIAQWNEEKFLQFFYVVQRFTDEGVIKIKPEVLLSLEQEALVGSTSFLTEIFWRINQFTTDPNATPRKFYYKLASMIRQVGMYLKEHPAAISEKMRNIIDGHPRMKWMLVHYKEIETKVGAKIIVPNTIDDTLKERREFTPTPQNPQVQIMEAMTNLADMMSTLSTSITKKELREMDTKDKISAIAKIATVLTQGSKFKPNVAVFNQININKGSREELEKAIQDFGTE